MPSALALISKVPSHARMFTTVVRRILYSTRNQHNFSLKPAPCPQWRLGGGLSDCESWENVMSAPRKTWDLSETNPAITYKLLTSAIVPRPIAFVSTLDKNGTRNLAPMSYFSMISHNPPMISVSLIISKARPKDTRENILVTKEFTVSIVSESFAEAANATAVEAPASVDEWIVSGLTPEESSEVKPPFVKESAVAMECELYSHQDIPLSSDSSKIGTTLVLGRIKKIHVRSSVLTPDGMQVDIDKLRPIARMGGDLYARVTEGFTISRLSWKENKDKIGEMSK